MLLYNPESKSIHDCEEVTLSLPNEQRRAQIEQRKVTNNVVLLKCKGIENRSQAEQWRGAKVLVERAHLNVLEEGEYYHVDLVGCLVVAEDGQSLGQVAAVFNAGASDILVVHDGIWERLIPWAPDWILSVDLNKKIIYVAGADQWEPSRR